MIDLSVISGLPIKFDETNGVFYFDSCVKCSTGRKISLQEIVPTLLNKYIKYPENVYEHLQGVSLDIHENYDSKDFTFDIVALPYGLLGIEYIRTHLYGSEYQEGKFDAIVQVLTGKLTVLLQRNISEEDPYNFEKKVEEMVIVNLKKGDKIAIPSGFIYTFVNTGVHSVVFSKVTAKDNAAIDYNTISRERGLAYYIISKNARVETVPNPKYKILNTLRELKSSQYIDEMEDSTSVKNFCITEDPLYDFVVKQSDVVRSILNL